MEIYRTEEEQLDLIKRWLRENGLGILIAVALAIVLVLGWRYWNERQSSRAEAAAARYEALLEAVEQWRTGGDETSATTARTLAQNLKAESGDTAYGQLAALFAAKLAVDAQEFDAAEAELRWLLEQQPDPAMTAIANYRLARVLFARQQHAEALAQLDTAPLDSYGFLYQRLRGDILLSQGDPAAAHAAYGKALELEQAMSEPPRDVLLELKLRDLQGADRAGQES